MMRALGAFALWWAMAGAAKGAAQEVPVRTLSEVYRIGGASAPDFAAWSVEPPLVAAEDGTIYVRSSRPPSITVFSRDGDFVRSFGAEGEGPGEFQLATHHGLLGDTLWVTNFPEPRVSMFSGSGQHLRTDQHDHIDYGMPLSAPGTITALLQGPWALAVPAAVPLGVEGRAPVPVLHGGRRMTEYGALFDLFLPAGLRVEGVGAFAIRPYTPPPLIAIASDGSGFVRADWDDDAPGVMSVAVYRPDGSVAWQRQLPYRPRTLSDEERRHWVAAGVEMAEPHIRAARARGGVPGGSVQQLVADGLYLPEFIPPASAALMSPDGSVWLKVGVVEGQGEWLRLDREGAPSFRVRLPPHMNLQDVRGQTMWATFADGLEVPYVLRFDIH